MKLAKLLHTVKTPLVSSPLPLDTRLRLRDILKLDFTPTFAGSIMIDQIERCATSTLHEHAMQSRHAIADICLFQLP